MKRIFLLLLTSTLILSSCVTTKVHKDLQSRYDILNNENDGLRQKNQEYEVDLKETKALLDKALKTIAQMEKDSVLLGDKLRLSRKKYAELNKQYEFLLTNNSTMLAENAKQNKALLEKLEGLQFSLDAKADSLNLEQEKMMAYQEELELKNARLIQLETIIAKQDSTMDYVYNKLSSALMGFEGKGLTIERRNGKVYVSLENSLLFASGSWEVSPTGKMALDNLAQVLAENADINVLVEGHTDADAYKGTGQVKDNWDLSVMRSTAVVRILTNNATVEKSRITAAGKGMFSPVATNNTKDGKAQNRRIEIILTPDLEGLFNMVE